MNRSRVDCKLRCKLAKRLAKRLTARCCRYSSQRPRRAHPGTGQGARAGVGQQGGPDERVLGECVTRSGAQLLTSASRHSGVSPHDLHVDVVGVDSLLTGMCAHV